MNNEEECLMRDSCSNLTLESPSIVSSASFLQQRNCFCDSLCRKYGDCCNQSVSSTVNDYECIDVLSAIRSQNSLMSNPLSIWIRSKCLSMYVGSISDSYCQNLNKQTFVINPLLFIPVTSIDTNITYRNYYCAYCNNDVNAHLQVWEYRPNCPGYASFPDNVTLERKEQVDYYIHNLTGHCTKTINYPRVLGTNQPSVYIRPCKKPVVENCQSQVDKDLAQNCSLSSVAYRYKIHSDRIYRNSYCAQCNNINASQITCTDPYLRSILFPTVQTRVPSLSILFNPNLFKRFLNPNPNGNLMNQAIYSLSYNCTRPNELFDLFQHKCSPVTKSQNQITISMKCSYPMETVESVTKYSNGSIYLSNQSIVLDRQEYVFIDGQRIIFCADQWQRKKPTFSFYRNILTTICTVISLICLVVFTIVFWLMPSLHNRPGICLLLLSIAIFMGQSLFIFTSDLTHYTSTCLVSAILIHYFYLSSFFWLLVIAVQIHATFNSSFVRREKINNEKSNLLIYNVLVWCSSGIIVLIACLIQFTDPMSQFSPNYGHSYCAMSQPNAIILFFLVPIGCLLLMIAILFVKTILSIRRSHKLARLASSSSTSTHSSNHYVFIYARLASLMGLQWVLLIFALIMQQNWSWIMFELIDSLSGMFICFGFLCSQKLWSNIRQDILSKLVIRRQPSRSHTTSTMLMSPQSH